MTDSPRVRAPGSIRAMKPFAAPAVAAPAVKTSRHGIVLTDEFAWLKDPNWQRVMRDPRLLDPTIRKHLENENGYADDVLAATVPLQEALIAEMRGRIKEEDATVPAADGAFSYFTRYRDGGQHPSICREPRGGGAGDVVWTRDCSAFYYVRLDAQHRPSSVHRHRLGADVREDIEVYDVADGGRFVSLSRLQSGRFAAISVRDHDTSEAWLIDLEDADAEPMLVAPREPAMRYEIEHHPDFGGYPALLMRTNAGGAEDFKIAW